MSLVMFLFSLIVSFWPPLVSGMFSFPCFPTFSYFSYFCFAPAFLALQPVRRSWHLSSLFLPLPFIALLPFLWLKVRSNYSAVCITIISFSLLLYCTTTLLAACFPARLFLLHYLFIGNEDEDEDEMSLFE